MKFKSLIPHPTATKNNRSSGIGGTDARIIASGEGWLELYEEKLGIRKPTDLSRVWKPQLGLVTENLHALFHGYQTGDTILDTMDAPTTTRDILELHPYAYATFDRWVGEPDIALEMKHTNARNDLRSAATYYMGQLQWQMFVGMLPALRFSIICGNEEPVWGVVDRDDAYIQTLIAQVDAFWWHVTEQVPPEGNSKDGSFGGGGTADLAAIGGGVKIDGLKPYDLTTNNEWVAAATKYVDEKPIADGFKATEKALRALIPADAASITGGGLTVKRDARGANRITIVDKS